MPSEDNILSQVRRRVPFHFAEDSEAIEAEERVLDEQEQEEVIDKLSRENELTILRTTRAALCLVTLSLLLHLYFITSQDSPLLAILPPTAHAPPLPFATALSLFNFFSHFILLLRLQPRYAVPPSLLRYLRLQPFHTANPRTHVSPSPSPSHHPRLATPPSPTPSLRLALASPLAISPLHLPLLTFLPPLASLFTARAWQTTAWWAIAPAVTLVVHFVEDLVRSSDDGLAQLGSLRYRAPGA
ncbi:hypothetical protein HDZ31DRAFT_82186 [Schizophyllum fasciatum]